VSAGAPQTGFRDEAFERRLSARHRRGDLYRWLSFAAAAVGVITLAALLLDVLHDGLSRLSPQFLSSFPSRRPDEAGIKAALWGSIWMISLTALMAFPLGVGAAVYLEEYASNNWLNRLLEVNIANLAGVPSIVFGLFGLGFFVQFLGAGIDKAFFGGEKVYGQPALIWAALTMAVLTLPVVIVATEEALRAVPRELREASLALGATKFQTVAKVVVPQASAGILTGMILAVSRGAGEVAPILFTGAAYFLPFLPKAPTDQFMELGYHIFVLATQSPDVDATRPLLYGTVLVLLVLTLLLNLTAILLRARLRARLLGRG
jgi:phosphate transport system permease protein